MLLMDRTRRLPTPQSVAVMIVSLDIVGNQRRAAVVSWQVIEGGGSKGTVGRLVRQALQQLSGPASLAFGLAVHGSKRVAAVELCGVCQMVQRRVLLEGCVFSSAIAGLHQLETSRQTGPVVKMRVYSNY